MGFTGGLLAQSFSGFGRGDQRNTVHAAIKDVNRLSKHILCCIAIGRIQCA